MVLIELTVPYESRIDEAHIFKTEKYRDLAKDLQKVGYKSSIFAVEVGARGFVGTSVYDLLCQVSISSRGRANAIRLLSETAEKGSHWIWIKRNESELH